MDQFGDAPSLLKMLFALAFVVALMGGLAVLLKRLGMAGTLPTTKGQSRLKILESLPLDTRRRLVLLQRDDTQHLVILGLDSETVIETDITPPLHKEDPSDA